MKDQIKQLQDEAAASEPQPKIIYVKEKKEEEAVAEDKPGEQKIMEQKAKNNKMLKTLMHGMHDEIDQQHEVKVIEKVEEKGDDLDLIPEFTGKEAEEDPEKELSKLVGKIKISDEEMKQAANSMI